MPSISITQPGLFAKSVGSQAGLPVGLFCTSVAGGGQVVSSIAPLAMCNLASGSSGNATLLRFGEHTILIDAGIGPRTTAKRLKQTNVAVDDIGAIFLTHLDGDHFRPTWINKLINLHIPVLIHERHLSHIRRVSGAYDLEQAGLIHLFDDQPFELLPDVKVSTIRLPHDDKGSTGYRFDSPAGCVGYVTDLGAVSDQCVGFLANVDVLAIESNYDRQMQLSSSRPPFLKHRIMDGYGHLANDESFAAVQAIFARSDVRRPEYVVLLHASGQCNSQGRIREVFEGDGDIAGRVVLTDQGSRTDWIVVRR